MIEDDERGGWLAVLQEWIGDVQRLQLKSNLTWKRLRHSFCSPKRVESAETGAFNGGFSLHSWVRLNPHIIDMLLIRSNVIYNVQLIKKKSMRNYVFI